ncbi:hypothetical protein [Bosea sp. 124]|uniref:hypothetical protein n=1 Tax=Bosea sp. 124 TaxID=2135642 RepID=UPI000D39A72F|nr:hypothetical protein [Bosea sp. 124]PTM39292.1 hypothetical protein C8D03_0773 [Bosea sp. 124]
MSIKPTAGATCAVALSCVVPFAFVAHAQQPPAIELDTITVRRQHARHRAGAGGQDDDRYVGGFVAEAITVGKSVLAR